MVFKLKASGGASHAAPIDTVQLNRAMNLFLDADQFVFLQSLPGASWACLPCCEITKIEEWATKNQDGKGMYFGINPVIQIDRPSRVGDVVYRRWILVDIDRNKTLQPDDPATDQEHDQAGELAFEIMSFLGDIGFPAPVQIDSGNGHHLYYKINFPNDDTHRDLIRDFLKMLANTFNGDRGDVGDECFDARRISRIPGSWSRRGAASKDRPYRQCKFTYMPKDILEVPADVLRQLVNDDVKEAPASPTPFELVARNGSPDRIKAYGLRALDLECAKLASTPVKNRNNQLYKSTAALFQLVAIGALDSGTVKDALWVAANKCGLTDEKEVLGTIESGRKAGLSQPRELPEKLKEEKKKAENAKPDEPLPDRLIEMASEITPTKIQWLWPGRIPLGMMTTFAGSGGLGKTFCLLDIVSRVTTGAQWPDGVSGNAPGSVLYISGEDNPSDTLVPRLIASGADLTKVAFLKQEVLAKFSLKQKELIEAVLKQVGDDCRLICIDPPTSFLEGADDHKNSELRELLTPIGQIAGQRKVAVVFITHINKGGGGKVDAVMRIIGSVAWSTAVRAAHMFCEDPDDSEKCLFLVAKINGAKKRKGIAYKIKQLDETEMDGDAKVEWLGEVDTTANEAMSGTGKKKSRGEDAAEWLIDRFREKLFWSSKDLFDEAKAHGISESALWEAKRNLDLPKAKKTILPNGATVWGWWVPADWEGFITVQKPAQAKPATEFDEAEF